MVIENKYFEESSDEMLNDAFQAVRNRQDDMLKVFKVQTTHVDLDVDRGSYEYTNMSTVDHGWFAGYEVALAVAEKIAKAEEERLAKTEDKHGWTQVLSHDGEQMWDNIESKWQAKQ